MKHFQIISVLDGFQLIRFETTGYFGFRYLKNGQWETSQYEAMRYNEIYDILSKRVARASQRKAA